MSQTSRLSIVVDTSNAKQRLSDFTKQLNDVTRAATNMAEKVEKSLSTKGSQGASSQISGLTRETNLLGTAAQQAALMQDRLTASAAKTATAQANATKAAANAATAQNRQAASANSVTISNNNLVQSEFAVERAMNKTIATETRLQIIQNSLAGSALRLGTAQQNAAISATLGQDKLTASTHRVAAAASAANLASSKFVISQHNEATAALRTTAQLSRLATEQQRTAAATSAAAGAATRAAINLNGLTASAVRVQREEARLQAELLRTNALAERQAAAAARAAAGLNGMGNAADRANQASRGLHGTMSKMYTLLNSGLVAVTGLGFIKTAAEMQNLNNQIRLVTKSEKEYAGVKQQVIKIANENYNSIAATTSLYQKSARALGNLGKTQQEALQFTNAISLAMRVGGRSAGEQAAALLQLGQAMGAGVIMGDEFRSISENAPILLSLVAKRMGVMQGELKKMSADGLITAEIMYDAVVENEKMLEDIAKGMPITMGQAFILVKNKYTETVDTMMNKTGGFSDKLSGLMVGITKNFETIVNTIKVAGVLAFVSFAGSVNVATRSMAALNFVMGLNPLVRIALLVMGVASAFYGLDDVMETTSIVFSDLMSLIGTGLSGIMEMTGDTVDYMSGKFQEGANNGDIAYQGFFDNTEKGFLGFLQGSSRTIAAASAVIVSFWQWFGSGMWDVVKAAGNLFIGLGNVIKGAFISAASTINDALDDILGRYDIVANKVNGVLKKANSPWILSTGNKVERREPTFKADKAYFEYDNKSMQSFIPKNLEFFMPLVNEAYFKNTGQQINNRRNPADLSGDIGTGLIDKDSPAGMAAAKAREELEKAKKAAKKTAKGSKKTEKVYAAVNKTVLTHAAQYKYAEIEAEYASLPKGILAAIEMQESRGVSNARGPKTKYGVAKGAFQFLDGTAKDMKVKNVDNVEQAAHGAAKYLDQLIREFNSVDVGIAAYNAGPGNTRKYGGKQGKIPPFKQTIGYVKGVNEYLNYMGGGSDGSVNVSGNIEAAQKKYDEAMKALAEEYKERMDIMKEYENTPQKIERELIERLGRITAAGFGAEQQESLIGKAIGMANRESLVYTKSLNDLADANDDFRKTELEKIEKNRENLKFEAEIHPFLSLPENSGILKKVIEDIDHAMDYEVEKDKIKNERLIDDLYAFKKTEKQVFEDEWKSRLAEAETMTDEIKFVRIEALKEEMSIRQELLNLGEIQERLDLNKYKMTATEYMVKNIAIQRAQINQNPKLTDEKKREQSYAAGQPIRDTFEGMLNGFDGSGTAEGNSYLAVDAQYKENIEKIKAYEKEIDLIEGDAREVRLAAEKEFYRAKAAIMVNDGENIMSSLSSIAKDTMGEQSSIFRAMFAMEKGFAIARSIMNIQVALSSAAASLPFPANLGAISTVAMEGASIISSLKAVTGAGFEKGGYTGSMGTKDIAGVVHGQEYVFDAQSTKRIGVDNLNAMRSGKSVGGGDVNINVNVDAKGNAQVSGNNERMGREMANGIKAVVIDTLRKEKRQGGMLYA